MFRFATRLSISRAAFSTVANAGAATRKTSLALPLGAVAGSLALIGGGFYFYSNRPAGSTLSQKQPIDYRQVAKDIAGLLEKDESYDDGLGHYGPILVRLAWHSAGTFDKHSGTGGSDGATMRFEPESAHGANAGLSVARALLEPIKKKYGDELSYGDLWTLAGVVAIKEMGGPVVAWRPGRLDAADSSKCPPDGRLPDASKTHSHLRDIFYRMGFNDQDIVALSGAHALGKCHTDRSGFKGPWTFSPTSFSNQYFVELLGQKWTVKKYDTVVENGKSKQVPWKGPLQYTDATGQLMMLPSDLALIQDNEFKKHVQVYAKDQDKFFADFAKAFGKLLELGVSEMVLSNPVILI